MTRYLAAIITVILPLIFTDQASAHSFGKLYNLPVPFWMYLYGGVGAIIASFVIIGYFVNQTKQSTKYHVIALTQLSHITKPLPILLFKIMSVLLLVITITSGFIGSNEPTMNINMNLFWIVFVLLLTYATAIFGNVYVTINPLKALIEWGELLLGKNAEGFMSYPKWLGYFPALVFYYGFIWIELVLRSTPLVLSLILLQYVIFTIVGVIVFGKSAWFQYAELFSVFFRLIGKMSIIERRNNKLFLRPPFVGLLHERAKDFSELLFILFMLSSTAFDGFHSTRLFNDFYWLHIDALLKPLVGDIAFDLYQTFWILLSPFIFLLLYLALLGIAKILTQTKVSLRELALRFAFSLIPIAFVYNIAHYFTLVITEGSNLIHLISDPFGWNWNLFGTIHYPTITAVDTTIVWHTQVIVILIGHIIGVYIAHLLALEIFPTHKKALLSQFPMLTLMVIYTMIGLWILSQPVTLGT